MKTERTAKILALVLLALIALAVAADAFSLYYILSNGMFGKVWKIVWHNFQFPTALLLVGAFGAYWKYRYPKDFTHVEFAAYIILLPIIMFPIAGSSYLFSTDLHDIEIWNGRVVRATYDEAWTEEVTDTTEDCSGSGKNKTCRTVTSKRNVYHPPEWSLTTNNDEVVPISEREYSKLVFRFDNHRMKYLFHMNQVSIGDGNRYYTVWRGEPAALVPTAVEHPFVNYLRASNSIRKIGGVMSSYSSLLLPYPRVHPSEHGSIKVDRVLSPGVALPAHWAEHVSDALSRELSTLGRKKQVNALVYVVNADIGFVQAIREFWTEGKKNDVIVVIGSDGQNIKWAQVLAWTKVELFKIRLADKVRALNTLDGNEGALVSAMASQIAEPPESGGFQRMQMAELEYLLSEIDLPWWASVLMIIWTLIVASPLILYFTNNRVRQS